MQIQCPECQKSFPLPADKVPKAATVYKCPSCGGRIPVAPPPAEAKAAPAPEPKAPARPPVAADAPAPADLAPALPSEVMDELRLQVTREILRSLGLKRQGADLEEEDADVDGHLALICEDEEMFQGVISDALRTLGYRVEIAPSVKTALDKVSLGIYSLVTVDNRFPDDPDGGYKILQAINALPPDRRRKLFVAFISADLATMDLNSAFILGANLTVGKKDVKRLDKILAEGIHEHDRRYRVFFQVEQEVHNEKD